MRMMDVDKLNPHPKNSYFFDDIEGEPWVAFLESIETSGVIEPVIVSAPDLTIVSGHQRVRACKKLGIKQVAVEERTFDSEDEILKQLIETNICQRGIGNINFVKLGRCADELKRIQGIRHGGDRKSEIKRNNVPLDSSPQTMSELAERFGVNEKTLREAIRISKLPSDLQQMVMDGKITPSTASRMIARLTPEEQKQLLEQISGKEKLSGKAVEAEIAKLKAENKRLKDENLALTRRAEPNETASEVIEISKNGNGVQDTEKEVAETAGLAYASEITSGMNKIINTVKYNRADVVREISTLNCDAFSRDEFNSSLDACIKILIRLQTAMNGITC